MSIVEKVLGIIKNHIKIYLIFVVIIVSILVYYRQQTTTVSKKSDNVPTKTSTATIKSNIHISDTSSTPTPKINEQEVNQSLYPKTTIFFTQTNAQGQVVLSQYSQGSSQTDTVFPSNIRSIIPLSTTQFLFLNNLGFLDRAAKIDILDTVTKKITSVTIPSEGYLIENVIVSPKKDAVVFWEVETGATTHGKTHIVYQSLQSKDERKVLINESLSDQTKYPIAWLKDDVLLFDSYSVNKKGLHQGIFSLPLNTTPSTVSLLLPADTYSSLPVVAEDGKSLIFSSYNKSAKIQLPAPSVPNGLFRVVIRNPNQLISYDLSSGKSEVLMAGSSGELFTNITSLSSSNTISYRRSVIENNQIKRKDIQILALPTKTNTPLITRVDGYLLTRYGTRYLLGFGGGTVTGIGGLDESYSQVYDSVYLYDPSDQSYEKILSDNPVQIIGIL